MGFCRQILQEINILKNFRSKTLQSPLFEHHRNILDPVLPVSKNALGKQ